MKFSCYTLMVVFYFISQPSFGQKYCAEHIATGQYLQKHPDQIPSIQQFEQQLIEETQQAHKTNGTVYYVPVVFHILHKNGPENISDSQIHDAMRILNEDYRKLNGDIVDVVSNFQGITADAEIEFRLAQKDPAGNCTNGIDRIYSLLTDDGDDNAKLNPWPRNKYLNVWVVNNITVGPNVAGYAYKPFNVVFDPTIDGVMILHDYIGSIGTANTFADHHSLSHEVGHWLNLSHVWGSTNDPTIACGDDGISDTPVTKGWLSCNLTTNAICTAGVKENVQNFMEYSNCTNMFTQGQVTAMRTALNSAISQRNNLSTPANLAATGTDGNNTLCEAAIYQGSRSACLGENYTFYDASYHGPTSWNWTISNANPSSSTTQNPTVEFLSEGFVDVSLTVSNASGTLSVTENEFLRVLPSSGLSVPATEGFENGPYPDLTWDINNIDDDAFGWSQVSGTSYSGSKCMKMSNLGNTAERIDELISPLYDFSNLTQVVVKFKVAFAQKGSSLDFLRVYVSPDCGETWTLKFVRSGTALSSVSAQNTAFTPANTTQWKEFTFNYSTTPLLTESVLLKFAFESDEGNNLYLDDINITGTYSAVPVLDSPSNNSTFGDTDTTIDWKAVGDVDLYEYQVDTTSSFNSALFIQGTHNYIDYDSDDIDTKQDLTGLMDMTRYYWRVRAKTGSNYSNWSNTWSFYVNQSLHVTEPQKNIANVVIYPNPFSNFTTLSFNVLETDLYNISIYDLQGRKIDDVLSRAMLGKGTYTIQYENANLPAGIHLVKFWNEKTQYLHKISVLAH